MKFLQSPEAGPTSQPEAAFQAEDFTEGELTEAEIQAQIARLATKYQNLSREPHIVAAIREHAGEDGMGTFAEIQAVEASLDEALQESRNLTPEEMTSLQTMSNAEFLKIPATERLRLVTKNSVDSAEVANGNVTDLEHTFTFNGQYNEELWHKTTAGQTLPPEVRSITAGTTEFHRERDSLTGEFFSEGGERLQVHEGTQLSNMQIGDLSAIRAGIESGMEAYADKEIGEQLMARAALEKGIDPAFAIAAFRAEGDEIELNEAGDALATTYGARFEGLLTNIDRAKDAFLDISGETRPEVNGRVTPEFASFYIAFDNQNESRRTEVMTAAEYTAAEISASESWFGRATERSRNHGGGGEMAELSLEDLDGLFEGNPAEIEASFRNQREFEPGSPEAARLFTYAALRADMGLSREEAVAWGSSPELHYILGRESGGVVGRLNYTLPQRGVSLERVRNGDKGGARSSATGLGQCLWENVDNYYPDGRAGIGDPLNEAVGMLRYIRDRYGSPEAARSVYGRTGSYTHAVTGRRRTKTFREGY